MPRTQAEEEEYQNLLADRLPFQLPPTPQTLPARDGLFLRFGKDLANVPAQATEFLMGTGTGIANLFEPTGQKTEHMTLPSFKLDVATPETLGEHATDFIPNLLAIAPSFLVPGGLAAKGLGMIGAGARAAAIGGHIAGGLAGGLAVSPQSSLAQGGIGGLTAFSESLPRPARALFALGAAGLGAADVLSQGGSTGQALAFGGIQGLGVFAGKQIPKDIGGGRPIEGQPVTSSPLPGGAGVMDSAFQAMNPAQKQAHLNALMGRSGPAPVERPMTGLFGRDVVTPDGQPAIPKAGYFGPDLPMTGPSLNARIQPGEIRQTGQVSLPVGEDMLPPQGTNPYDIFAGLQQRPNENALSPREQAARFPALHSPGRITMPETNPDFNSAEFIYGRGTAPFDITQGLEHAPQTGPLDFLTPRERALKSERAATIPSSSEPAPTSRVIAPEGKGLPTPRMAGPHIISTAIKSGKKILIGSDPNQAHGGVGIEHGIDNVAEETRGFLTQNADGTQGFANRKRAAKIAFKAGQIKEPLTELHSESLRGEAPPTQVTSLQAGYETLHWTEMNIPNDVHITKVEDGMVHYVENDAINGTLEEKMLSVDQFKEMEKPLNNRAAAKIKEDSVAPPVTPETPPKQEPVKPAAPARASEKSSATTIKSGLRIFSNHIEDSTRTVRASFGEVHEESEFADAGWTSNNAIVLENIVNLKGTTGSGKASEVLEGVKDLAFKQGKAVLLQPIPSKQFDQLKAWYTRHGFEDRGGYWVAEPVASLQYGEAKSGERIVAAATKHPVTGEISTGTSHAGIEDKWHTERKWAKTPYENLGFMTDRGRFLTREQARKFNPKKEIEYTGKERKVPFAEDFETIASLQPRADQVRVQGKYGPEVATIVGRDGDTLHVEIEDPIFGNRRTSVLVRDTLPMESAAPATPKAGVPFQDVKGAKTQLDRADERYGGEGGLLASVMEGAEPGRTHRTLPGRGKTVLSIAEALAKLPPEAATIIGSLISKLALATKQKLDISFAQHMPGMKGGMYEGSGKVVLNLQWINSIVEHWPKLKPEQRGAALMRVAALMGHEITHVAQKFGERTNLHIDGVPLTQIIMDKVGGLSLDQRKYVVEQIQKAKGDPSKVVSLYLSGDLDAVHKFYASRRPNLTRDGARELAAGEFMSEIGAVELIKRMEVKGLPNMMRQAIDKFKQTMLRVIDWFRGHKDESGVASLQGLSRIAEKMYDHLGGADEAALHKAFPANDVWRPSETPNLFLQKLGAAGAPVIGPSETLQPYVRSEMVKLGLRVVAGGVAGGIAGPELSDHRLTLAESVIAGGVMGAFGPKMVKAILASGIAKDLKITVKEGRLRELGAEGRYGLKGDASAVAKAVRFAESELKLNNDSKIKAIFEQGRGTVGYPLHLVHDALRRTRFAQISQGVKDATTAYIEGHISVEAYRALLTDDTAKAFGELMVAARTGTTVFSENLATGMRKSALRTAIIQNKESYVGRFYRAFTEGKFDDKFLELVKKDLMELNPGTDIHNADAFAREYMVEVRANRKLFGRDRGAGAQAIDSKLRFRRRATEEEIELQNLEVQNLEHDPYSPAYKAAKDKFDWMEKNKITDNWRGWLGEIKDPTERMLYTFQKILPSSIAGKIFDLLDNGQDSFGNKFAYTGKELTTTRSLLTSEIARGGPNVATLQTRLKELEAFTPLPEGAAYGKLSGKFTNRFVRDEISTYDTPYKWMDQPIIRAIAEVNSLVKINRTVLNPATMIRNYLQMPLQMLIARVSPQEIWQTVQVIHKNSDPALLKLMYEKHILGADYASQELTTNLGSLVSGRLDADIASKVAMAGYDMMRTAYQQPDMLVRAGAFISSRKRLAARAFEAEDTPFASLQEASEHPSIIDAAVEDADRKTFNYATVPRIVKAGRQLPFVSLFISYTSEITKIIKNLSVDAINADGKVHPTDRMHAVATLAGMAAIPPLLVADFEQNLSERDRRDWHKLRGLQPDYARSRFYLPLSREVDGRFRYMDMTTLIPADNYTQMMKSAIAGDFQAARAANPIFSLQDTPLLNMATEQISGQDLRTGMKLTGTTDRVKELLKEILPPIIPPGFEGQRLANAFSRNSEGTMGLTNLKTGVQTRPGDIIASYLTGMRFANVQLSSVQRSAVSKAQQLIADEKQYMNDTVRLNVPDEERRQAINRYSESVKQIMLQLNERMGVSPVSSR